MSHQTQRVEQSTRAAASANVTNTTSAARRRRGNSWSDVGWRRQLLASLKRTVSPFTAESEKTVAG